MPVDFGVVEVLVEPGARLVAVAQELADEGAAGVLLLVGADDPHRGGRRTEAEVVVVPVLLVVYCSLEFLMISLYHFVYIIRNQGCFAA